MGRCPDGDEANGCVGYVLRFEIDDDFISQHEIHEAGGQDLCEYWIPAEDLDEFNDAIRGPIEIVRGVPGQPARRIR